MVRWNPPVGVWMAVGGAVAVGAAYWRGHARGARAAEKNPPGERWLIKWGPWIAGFIVVVGAATGIWAIADPQTFATDAQQVSGATDAETAQLNLDRLNHGRDSGLKYAAGLAAIAAGVLSLAKFQQSREDARRADDTSKRADQDQDRADKAQYNQRFIDAVTMLGAGKTDDVKLGGLYSLEQLALDSTGHVRPITEVICAYLRAHSKQVVLDEDSFEEVTVMDRTCRAALTVVSHLARSRELPRLNLRGITVRGEFSDLDLREADLRFANLERAKFDTCNLYGADLKWADLTSATFENVDIGSVDLHGSFLNSAKFTTCWLHHAILTEAEVRRARFDDVDMTNADLSGSDFTGADLSGANLTQAKLARAVTKGTLMPTGWEEIVAYCPDGTQPPTSANEGG